MPTLLGIPILAGLIILQSAVISRIPLLHGTADLVLLVIVAWALRERVRAHWQWSSMGGLMASFISGLPFGVLLGGYLLITLVAVYVRSQIWRVPALSMLAVTFLGTLIIQFLSIASLWVVGTTLPILDTLNLIVLPSLLLNLLLALPVYIIIKELADWLYPEEIEI
jgi:cell shape-determining protein MreD